MSQTIFFKYLPADLITYFLNPFAATSPPYHVTLDDISPPPPPERLEVETDRRRANPSVDVVVPSRQCTNRTGLDSAGVHGNANLTYVQHIYQGPGVFFLWGFLS